MKACCNLGSLKCVACGCKGYAKKTCYFYYPTEKVKE